MKDAQKFKKIAKEYFAIHTDFQDLVDDNMSFDEIEETLFHRSEYYGGMAIAIITMIEKGVL